MFVLITLILEFPNLKLYLLQATTVDRSEILHHLICIKPPKNNVINYQPQLVLGGFLNHQQYEETNAAMVRKIFSFSMSTTRKSKTASMPQHPTFQRCLVKMGMFAQIGVNIQNIKLKPPSRYNCVYIYEYIYIYTCMNG